MPGYFKNVIVHLKIFLHILSCILLINKLVRDTHTISRMKKSKCHRYTVGLQKVRSMVLNGTKQMRSENGLTHMYYSCCVYGYSRNGNYFKYTTTDATRQ